MSLILLKERNQESMNHLHKYMKRKSDIDNDAEVSIEGYLNQTNKYIVKY